MWSKDIKIRTPNISATIFDKILKRLQSMELIKSFKSVASKHKKMYILFELEPAPQIAGGTWHTDQEYDEDLISVISNVVLVYLSTDKKGKTIQEITAAVKQSGVASVELTEKYILYIYIYCMYMLV